MTDKPWANYERRYAAMKNRHWEERQAEMAAQKGERQGERQPDTRRR